MGPCEHHVNTHKHIYIYIRGADGAAVREADGARTGLLCGRRMERGRGWGAVRPGRRGADGAAMLGG